MAECSMWLFGLLSWLVGQPMLGCVATAATALRRQTDSDCRSHVSSCILGVGVVGCTKPCARGSTRRRITVDGVEERHTSHVGTVCPVQSSKRRPFPSPSCHGVLQQVTLTLSPARYPAGHHLVAGYLQPCDRISLSAACWQACVLDAGRSAQTTIGQGNFRPLRIVLPKTSPFTITITAPFTTASSRARASVSSTSRPPAPAEPVPARWSLTNRLFNLNFRSLYNTTAPPRPPASRLWNPVNSSPRTLALPNVPVQHPQLGDRRPPTRDEYPLLTLPEQRQSRQSPAPSSLVVERSTGEDSRRTSIGLPRDRISQPPTPKLKMPVEQEPPAPTDAKDNAPIPVGPTSYDLEAGAKDISVSPNFASLPSRPGSMNSQRTGSDGDGGRVGNDNTSEFAWGPAHPCFPHPNPHVPLNTPLYDNTRIIRVGRDWMVKGDLAPTFANLYPEILDPLVSEDDFRGIIKHINDTLIDAFDPLTFRAFFDAAMGVATFWLWEDLGFTNVKKKLANLEKWIELWNQDHGEKEGVKIMPLRRTGYLTLDIQIPDPRFELASSNRGESRGAAPLHNDYAPHPITPTLKVSAGSPVAIGAQS